MAVREGRAGSTGGEAASALSIKWNPYIPHVPEPKQHVALMADHKLELLYGGAAGGGKSDFLLMAGLQYVDCIGYSGLILRRTFPELALEDGLLPRAQEWLEGRAIGRKRIDGMPTIWEFPDSGARLTFGHMEHEKTKFNYKGGAYQFIGWDELTSFTLSQYTYLFSRLRRPKRGKGGHADCTPYSACACNVPLRIRGATNPEPNWVRDRFIDEKHAERAFVPAKIQDNPHLDREEYEKSLEHLHPYDREQLLEGNWDATPPGARFRREWFPPTEIPPERCIRKKIRYWDLAATEEKDANDPDYSVGTLGYRCEGFDFPYVFDLSDHQRFRMEPGELEQRILAVAESDGPEVTIWIEQEGGASGKIASKSLGRMLNGFDVHFERPTGNKVVRSNPLASAAHRGEVGIVRGPALPAWLRELEHFSGDGRGHDDQVDSASGCFNRLSRGGFSWSDLRNEQARQPSRSSPRESSGLAL